MICVFLATFNGKNLRGLTLIKDTTNVMLKDTSNVI